MSEQIQTVNLFETAVRNKWRFDTERGPISAEDLWDMPLMAKRGLYDLNSVARTIDTELTAATEKNFVIETVNPKKNELAAKLDLVKYVIATIQAEARAKAEREALLAKRRRLLAIKEKKKEEELENLTPEQVDEELAKLGL